METYNSTETQMENALYISVSQLILKKNQLSFQILQVSFLKCIKKRQICVRNLNFFMLQALNICKTLIIEARKSQPTLTLQDKWILCHFELPVIYSQ